MRRPVSDRGSAELRREFLRRAAVTAAGLFVVTTRGVTQSGPQTGAPQSAAGGVEMTSDSYKPVRRDPKPGAKPGMDAKQVEALERNLACPCPCTLDVYTCRTTDFSCGISPAVHGDIQRLVDGGYSADEIMAAMMETYGDFILMQPRKQGFNLLAWFAPFAGIALGAVAIGALLRQWRMNAVRAEAAAAGRPVAEAGVDATPEELARLDAALREER